MAVLCNRWREPISISQSAAWVKTNNFTVNLKVNPVNADVPIPQRERNDPNTVGFVCLVPVGNKGSGNTVLYALSLYSLHSLHEYCAEPCTWHH